MVKQAKRKLLCSQETNSQSQRQCPDEEEKQMPSPLPLKQEQEECISKRARRLKRIQVSSVFDPLAAVNGTSVQVCQKDFDYEYKCSICLEQLSERTRPDSCRHDFCLECIFAWTRYSDKCPLCKVKITHLNKFDPLCPTQVTQTFYVEPKAFEKPTDDYVIEFADHCYICQQVKDDPNEEEASLMVCDGCDYNLAHFQCAGKRVFPTDEWFCFACVAQAREQAEIDKLALKLRNKIRKERRKAQEPQYSSTSKSTSSDTHSVQQNIDITDQLRKNQIFGEESDDELANIQAEQIQDDSSQEECRLKEKKNWKAESKFEKAVEAVDYKKRTQKLDRKQVQSMKCTKEKTKVQTSQLSSKHVGSIKRSNIYRHSVLHRTDNKSDLSDRQGIGRRGELAAAILKITPSSDNAKVRARLPLILNGQILSKPQQRPPQQQLETFKPDIDFFENRNKTKAPIIPIQKLKPCLKEKVKVNN